MVGEQSLFFFWNLVLNSLFHGLKLGKCRFSSKDGEAVWSRKLVCFAPCPHALSKTKCIWNYLCVVTDPKMTRFARKDKVQVSRLRKQGIILCHIEDFVFFCRVFRFAYLYVCIIFIIFVCLFVSHFCDLSIISLLCTVCPLFLSDWMLWKKIKVLMEK